MVTIFIFDGVTLQTSHLCHEVQTSRKDQKMGSPLLQFIDLHLDCTLNGIFLGQRKITYYGNLIGKSRVTLLLNRKSRITLRCPVPHHAADFGSVPHHASRVTHKPFAILVKIRRFQLVYK